MVEGHKCNVAIPEQAGNVEEEGKVKRVRGK